MRRALDARRDHAPHLRELLHEVRLRVQAAGGVDDDDVAAVAPRALDRVVGDGRRVSPALALDELGVGALAPRSRAALPLRRGTCPPRRRRRSGRARAAGTRACRSSSSCRCRSRRRRGSPSARRTGRREAALRRASPPPRPAPRSGRRRRRAPRGARRARPSPGRRRRRRSAPPRAAPTTPCRPGRTRAAASSCVSARAAAAERVAQAREQTRALLAALRRRAGLSPSSSPQVRATAANLAPGAALRATPDTACRCLTRRDRSRQSGRLAGASRSDALRIRRRWTRSFEIRSRSPGDVSVPAGVSPTRQAAMPERPGPLGRLRAPRKRPRPRPRAAGGGRRSARRRRRPS